MHECYELEKTSERFKQKNIGSDLTSKQDEFDHFQVLSCRNFSDLKAIQQFALSMAVEYLNQAGLFSPDDLMLLQKHDYPQYLAFLLHYLHEAGFSKNYIFTVIEHTNVRELVSVLSCLRQVGILTQENFIHIFKHNNRIDLADIFRNLYNAGILNQENFFLVIEQINLDRLSSAFQLLSQFRILNQENFSFVVSHHYPNHLASVFCILQQARILQVNRFIVTGHPNVEFIESILTNLLDAKILTQENLVALMSPRHALLLTEEAMMRVWNIIPYHLLTQRNFMELLRASEHINPWQRLAHITNRIFHHRRQHIQVRRHHHLPNFNPLQSTHTASIHQTVSASAVRLFNLYKDNLNFNIKIKEINIYINGLEDTAQNLVAKRCIKRLTNANYNFTDASGISIRQLLVLAWVSIHDDLKRSGSIEDAKLLFLEGLCEIQRGYNIESGIGEDNPICMAGAFNKIMEKLSGIHSDVEVVYVTHEGAYYKFPKLAKEHALKYLKSMAHPKNVEEYQKIKELFVRLKETHTIEPIWGDIKEVVKCDLWNEFSDAYVGNQNDERFIAIIENGVCLEAPDVEEIESHFDEENKPFFYEVLRAKRLTFFESNPKQDTKENIDLMNK